MTPAPSSKQDLQKMEDAAAEGTDVWVRLVEEGDEPAIASVIRDVMDEHGVCGPDTARDDAEVGRIHKEYSRPRHAYFVAVRKGLACGGGGIGQLRGGDDATCELRKMYLRPELRGLGLGRAILARLLEAARAFGYKRCYLETMRHMEDARRLYIAAGFQELCEPMGDTGHTACNARFLIEL